MMLFTLLVLFLAVSLFIHGRLRSDLVAMGALLLLLLGQVLTVEEALSGFSNPVVLMMIGLFVVSGAVLQTGLAKMLSAQLLRLGGNSETRLFLIIMLGTALMGAFISVLGTVALMLPIVVSMCSARGCSVRRFLIPLAYAGGMGGMLTLIGTPPNMVIREVLAEAGGPALGFFSFFPLGLVCVLVGTLLMLPLSKWLLHGDTTTRASDSPKGGKTLNDLAHEYALTENLFRVRLTNQSPCCGQSMKAIGLRENYHLTALEIRRKGGIKERFLKTSPQAFALPDTILQTDDIIYVMGSQTDVKTFADAQQARLLDRHESEEVRTSRRLDFTHHGIAEIMPLPGSPAIGQTVRDLDFRHRYHLNVLGIQRKRNYLLRHLGNVPVASGDVLLVQGTWQHIARLSRLTSDWVVAGQPLEEAARVTLDHKAPIAAIIMIAMIAMMVFDFIPVAPVTAVLLAGLLMMLTGCFRSVEAAYKTINWESVVLIAAMMPLSLALEKTGASTLISELLVTHLGNMGPYALMAGIYVTTAFITNFISNTATAVIVAPIAIHCATQLGCSPIPFLFAVTYGASMCFTLPFATPTNAIVMPIGHYTTMDYIRMGLPLQLLMGILMIFIIPLFFPF